MYHINLFKLKPKYNLIIIFIFLNCFINSNAQNLNNNKIFTTPEDFGCISNDPSFADYNSKKLQSAIDFATKNGLKLISSANKNYYISKGVIIKGFIDIDFGKATITATDSINMITIRNGIACKWAGSIRNIRLNLNKKARIGINCENAIKIHIASSEIINIGYNAIGLHIKKGYEIFIDNIHFYGGENKAIGIKTKTSDCHFSDCAIIDCWTAIYNQGSNFYDRIHAWMGTRWLNGSTFFKGNGSPVFLSQCYSDTFEKSFDITGKIDLYISQLRIFHNTKMWNKPYNKIEAKIFNFFNQNTVLSSKIKIMNSHIGTLLLDNINRQVFSNYDNPNIEIIGTTFE